MSNGDRDRELKLIAAFTEANDGQPPTPAQLDALMKVTDRSTDAGEARVIAAIDLARRQIRGDESFTTGALKIAYRNALADKGIAGEEAEGLMAENPLTQAAVDAQVRILNEVGEPVTPVDPLEVRNKLRKDVETAFFRRMNAAPNSDRAVVWQQVQSDFGAELNTPPPAFEAPAADEPDLLSKVGEGVRREIQKLKTNKQLTRALFVQHLGTPNLTESDRNELIRIFTEPTTTPGGTGPPVEIEGGWGVETVTGTGPPVSGRTLIGLSGVTGTGVGVSPMSEFQRLQIELAEQRIDLDEAKQRWTETKEQFWQARAEATEKLNREKFNRAIFESDRSTRLRRDESLLTGRLTAAHQANQATLAALPYLAPKSEFLPGQEPGGSLARLKSFSGAEHVPVRTADVSVAFNADAAAEQALAEFDVKTSNI